MPTLNSLVGSTSLFNYKLLMTDSGIEKAAAATASTATAKRLSSLSTTISTTSSSTSYSITSSEVETTNSCRMRSRATSTPKLGTSTSCVTVERPFSNRFSTASTVSSISTTTNMTSLLPPQPQSTISIAQDTTNMRKSKPDVKPKERVDRRSSKRASFKEKLSRINKRWSVSRLNETTSNHHDYNEMVIFYL